MGKAGKLAHPQNTVSHKARSFIVVVDGMATGSVERLVTYKVNIHRPPTTRAPAASAQTWTGSVLWRGLGSCGTQARGTGIRGSTVGSDGWVGSRATRAVLALSGADAACITVWLASSAEAATPMLRRRAHEHKQQTNTRGVIVNHWESLTHWESLFVCSPTGLSVLLLDVYFRIRRGSLLLLDYVT